MKEKTIFMTMIYLEDPLPDRVGGVGLGGGGSREMVVERIKLSKRLFMSCSLIHFYLFLFDLTEYEL